MKAALIPPIPDLDLYGRSDFHLLLSHLLDDKRYFTHYRNERTTGAYLVLDNSAHEHRVGEGADVLAGWAHELNAQEVVVPDCLEDGPGTVDSAVLAHEMWFEGNDNRMRALDPSLMYVPQGANYAEWKECLSDLVSLHRFSSKKYKLRKDFVIGISKDYEIWDGGTLRLLADDIYPLRASLKREQVNIQVHLLGWGRNLWRLEEIAGACPWVRSTDSAKPFVYAASDIDLSVHHLTGSVPEYPRRSDDYFESSVVNHGVAERNVRLFKTLASGA